MAQARHENPGHHRERTGRRSCNSKEGRHLSSSVLNMIEEKGRQEKFAASIPTRMSLVLYIERDKNPAVGDARWHSFRANWRRWLNADVGLGSSVMSVI